MPLKKHHKIIIGSLSSFLIVLLIANSVFIYILFGKIQYDYHKINLNLNDIKRDTNTKISEITDSIVQDRDEINKLNSELGNINTEFNQLDEEISKLKTSTDSDFSNIIESVIKSVVTIKTDLNQGTGFIIDEEGYIITNLHIIENAKMAGVYTYEGNQHSVKLIGINKLMDLALLKIEGNFNRLNFTESSDNILVGEKVIAIGNPLGLQFSVSEGIISAMHRPGPNEMNIYIQTDTALNPGNSGGPLINKNGEVIGINNFKIGSGENLGFALESNSIKQIINNITKEKMNLTLV
jgi:S1-C subfamily serine protease